MTLSGCCLNCITSFELALVRLQGNRAMSKVVSQGLSSLSAPEVSDLLVHVGLKTFADALAKEGVRRRWGGIRFSSHSLLLIFSIVLIDNTWANKIY